MTKKKIPQEFGLNAVREGRATPEQQIEVGYRYINLLSEKQRLLAEIDKLTARKPPVLIVTASDAKCAQAQYCFTGTMKPDRKRAWIERNDLFLNGDRIFALVTTTEEIFYMDAITGSLYALGECLTSPIGRTGFRRDNLRAAERLLNYDFDHLNETKETEDEV